MSSAQRHTLADTDLEPSARESLPPFELTEPDLASAPSLRLEVAERVAAHRARRGQASSSAAAPGAPASSGPSRPSRVRSANIAAAVAERYAKSQTYRAFLAAEAERAVHQAEAAAQIATINAQAIAVAQQQLLADLEDWNAAADGQTPATVPLSPNDYAALFDREFSGTPATPVRESSFQEAAAPSWVDPLPTFTVRPYTDAARPIPSLTDAGAFDPRSQSTHLTRDFDTDAYEDERFALEEEIEFRHHPVFAEASEQLPIAANLIEFPRQLIAARKARPRLAEGPLRDETSSSIESSSQLRIFEVEPEQINSSLTTDSAAPEWSSILLAALPIAEFTGSADYLALEVPQAAPIRRRLKAAIADGLIILAAQTAFVTVFRFALTHFSPDSAALDTPRPVAAAAAVAIFAVFTLLYQLLFFTFSDATPGMRFARIGLCTFSDTNPTRAAMRRRILATVLAVFPVGLGLLWALLDEDTLGWHDRISRMYQRSY